MIDKYGAKDAGMNPRERNETVPERASDTQRVSDFIRSFVESDKATVEMVEEVKAAVENGDFGVYAELPNKQLQQRAQNTISLKGVPKAQEDFSEAVRNGRINKDTGALGLQLIAEASKRGDSDSMLQLVADMAVYSTETGQATQALSMLKKMGGVGSAYYLQKVEDRMNAKYEKQIVSGKMLPVKIDGSLMQQLAMARTTEEITTLEDAIATNVMAVFNRRQKKKDEAADEREARRVEAESVQVSLLVATAKLSYAIAMAWKRGMPNGEVEDGIEQYKEAMTAFKKFERKLVAESGTE